MDTSKAAKRLSQLRAQYRYSRRDLSNLSDVSESLLYRLETNPQQWQKATEKTILKISTALNVTPAYLTGSDEGEEDMNNQSDVSVLPSAVSTFQKTLSPDAKAILMAITRYGGQDSQMNDAVDLQFDVTKPVTDRADLPRPEHQDESWQEQTLCFLEGQRRAFLSFLNYRDPSFDDLTDAMNREAAKFADMHGFPVTDDDLDDAPDVDPDVFPRTKSVRPQVLDESTTFFKKGGLFDTDPIVEADVTISDFSPRARVKVNPLDVDMDDQMFDKVEIDGQKLWVECEHGSKSHAAKDHPFAIVPETRQTGKK